MRSFLAKPSSLQPSNPDMFRLLVIIHDLSIHFFPSLIIGQYDHLPYLGVGLGVEHRRFRRLEHTRYWATEARHHSVDRDLHIDWLRNRSLD